MSPAAVIPVGLAGGRATFTGVITGGLTTPNINGHVAMHHFQVQQRQFDELDADIASNGSHVALQNGRTSPRASSGTPRISHSSADQARCEMS